MSDVFDSVMRGLDEVEAHMNAEAAQSDARVHIPEEINVSAIRATLGLSQSAFAMSIGVSKRTIENWEQGRRVPQGPARVLLTLIGKDPETVRRILAA